MAPPPPTNRCISVPGAGSGSTATRPASGPRGGPATRKSAGGSEEARRTRPRPPRPHHRLHQLPRLRLRQQVPTGREVEEEVWLHPRRRPGFTLPLRLLVRRPRRVLIPHHRRTRRRTKRRTRANPKPTPQTGPRPATSRTPPTLPLIVTPHRSRKRRRA